MCIFLNLKELKRTCILSFFSILTRPVIGQFLLGLNSRVLAADSAFSKPVFFVVAGRENSHDLFDYWIWEVYHAISTSGSFLFTWRAP